jgi:RimJ/RimL family protein N-acetyltransferase
MGIVFDPNQLSKGYGSESIFKIFQEFFNVMGMERLNLKVADFNRRARRVYEKCGFMLEKTSIEPFEFQQINKILKSRFDHFDDFDGVLYTSYHHMYMTKEKYLEMVRLSN